MRGKRLMAFLAAIVMMIAMTLTFGCAEGNSTDDENDNHRKPDKPDEPVITGILTVSLDASSPASKIIVGGTKKETVAIFKLTASDYEELEINQFTVTDTGTLQAQAAETWLLYSNYRSDGGDILTPIATTVGKNAEFILPVGTVIIPAGSNVTFKVAIDIGLVQPGTRVSLTNYNSDTFQASVDATGLIATGQTSGLVLEDSVITDPVEAAEHTVYQSRPYFTLNSNSPSGNMLSPNIEALITIFNVAADNGGDITFSNANGNYLAMEIYAECSTNSADEFLTLKDENNTVLSVAGPINICGWQTVEFFFEAQDLNILHGVTKKLYIYADTTEFISGDIIQAWFSDEFEDNLDWGIDGNGNYNEADIIFRGNLYANALILP